ncbi:hypothetical protein KAV67_00210 [Candidatus Bipolaricaulota bacterium]|nr:hypothetical protein [Candidatus Bipolaricaulota bacterium]
MRKVLVLALVFGVVMAQWGWGVALGQEIPSVIDHTMAVDVDEETYEPIGITYSFSVDAEVAISWINLGPVDRSHEVLWEWYSPDNEFYSTWSEMLEDPGEDYYWEEYPIWDWIDIADYEASQMPGEWRVDIYLDGILVLTENFTISDLAPSVADAPLGMPIEKESLDGMIGPEWDDAQRHEIMLGEYQAEILLKHDSEYFYIAMVIRTNRHFPAGFEGYVFFDNGDGRDYSQGDDMVLAKAKDGQLVEADYYYRHEFEYNLDTSVSGVNNAWGAGRYGESYTFEFIKEMASGDSKDIQISPGDIHDLIFGWASYGAGAGEGWRKCQLDILPPPESYLGYPDLLPAPLPLGPLDQLNDRIDGITKKMREVGWYTQLPSDVLALGGLLYLYLESVVIGVPDGLYNCLDTYSRLRTINSNLDEIERLAYDPEAMKDFLSDKSDHEITDLLWQIVDSASEAEKSEAVAHARMGLDWSCGCDVSHPLCDLVKEAQYMVDHCLEKTMYGDVLRIPKGQEATWLLYHVERLRSSKQKYMGMLPSIVSATGNDVAFSEWYSIIDRMFAHFSHVYMYADPSEPDPLPYIIDGLKNLKHWKSKLEKLLGQSP